MSDSKRILILTNDTGFGHRSAANAIASALKETHPEECVVDIVNPLDDPRAPAFLSEGQDDYDKMVREMPDQYKLRYEFSDTAVPNAIAESALIVLLYNIIRDLFEKFQPDAVISTHNMYSAPASAVISINKLKLPYLVVVTDLTNVHRMWFNPSVDMILVPTPNVREQALELGILGERVSITGIPVNPDLIKEARPPSAIREDLGWQPEMKTVLVVGSKRVKGLEDTLHVLNHAALPMQMAVVAGGDDDLYRWLEEYDWHLPVHLYNFIDNLPTLLRASDFVVSKAGGLIVTEALACGLPLLMVDVTPGQEEGNAEYVVKNSLGYLARTPIDALEHLYHWLHEPSLLSKFQERARSHGRPQSAFTVAELAWSAAERGPLPSPPENLPVLSRLLDLLSSFGIRSEESTGNEFPPASPNV